MSSGITPTRALSTVFDAARLATEPFSAVKSGITFSHPSGSSPASRRASSRPSSANAAAYASRRVFQSACAVAPRSST